jgi:hypothetical protein
MYLANDPAGEVIESNFADVCEVESTMERVAGRIEGFRNRRWRLSDNFKHAFSFLVPLQSSSKSSPLVFFVT